MNKTVSDQIVFVTLVRSPFEMKCARLLIDGIRSFGGYMSRCDVWLFYTSRAVIESRNLDAVGVRVFSLDLPDWAEGYYFADKTYACFQAEKKASADVGSLIWIDPVCLVVNPPVLFDLKKKFDAAVRPVHIRNVGIPPSQNPDGFWKKIFEAVGVDEIQTTLETFVDKQIIRSYFNTHAFAVDPAEKLLGKWCALFESLVKNEKYQENHCSDETHRIFLHQALFSALLATNIEKNRLRILQPDYNYPYNLQMHVPEARKADSLNNLVCFAYENRSLNPHIINDIEVREPLKSWLSNRIADS